MKTTETWSIVIVNPDCTTKDWYAKDLEDFTVKIDETQSRKLDKRKEYDPLGTC